MGVPSSGVHGVEQAAAPREVRLALVMNGGVSLAVWMGGVAHEIDLLRNASAHPPAGEPARPGEVEQIWSEVLAAAGERVVIDVVSGTSAGGLNGVLLATAIARGRALPSLRAVWERSASLAGLLKDATASSILNGETFTHEVAKAVELIDESGSRASNPVELLMTATALGGSGFAFKDSFSNPFEVQDHRRLYRFRHGERWTYVNTRDGWGFETKKQKDFGTDFTERLVLAARASASFPAAFPPVDDKPLLALQQRRRPWSESDSSCVMDGGVLNNAPFEPVLAAITGRGVAFSPVRRVLVYVVPSAGVRAQKGQGDRAGSHDIPNIPIYEPAWSALQYPSEANLRSSVDEMQARLHGRSRDMPSDLLARMWHEATEAGDAPLPPGLANHLIEAAQDLLGEYRRNRAYAIVLDARRRLADGTAEVTFADADGDDGGIEDCARLLLQQDDLAWVPRWRPDELTGVWSTWRWGLAAAERLLQCLSVHLRHLADHEAPARPTGVQAAQRALVEGDRRVTDALGRVLAAIESADADLQTKAGASSGPVDIDTLASLMDRMYVDLDLPDVLLRLVLEASGAYVEAVERAGLGAGWTADDVITRCLAIEVVTRVYASPARLLAPLPPEFAFLRLSPSSMSPLVEDPGLARLGDKKLYGLRLGHFGAFIDPKWRESDFVWGRLDAAHHLLSLFALPDGSRPEFERRLHRAILKEEAPRAVDGDGTPAGEEQALAWLKEHLAQAERCDTDLLREQAETASGKQLMRDLTGAVIRVVDSTLSPATPGGGAKQPWRKAVQVGRTVFAARPPARGPRVWLLRALTVWPRRRARRVLGDDPRKLHPGVLHAFVYNVAGAVAVLVGLAALITWLASRRR
ncbi:DUF3376 domain-containing protein [Streptomyces atroolivaceus]|uniref:DUF3376 domain-containing protein n=1 Tax=Streptomyces atroolivaceus TaxID=66869 RepID=UPI003419B84F